MSDVKNLKKRLLEWKPSKPGELPDNYTKTDCEYIDEEHPNPTYPGKRQVVAVFTDPNTNKRFKSNLFLITPAYLQRWLEWRTIKRID